MKPAIMDLILVMNAQNSWLSKAGSVYMGEKAEILKVRIIDYLSDFSGKKVFFREKHSFEDKFYVNEKTHSLNTTEDFKIEESLKNLVNNFYDKTRYNAFFNTNLDNFLRQKKVKNIGLMGVETHTSVLFTAEELRNRDYDVTVIEPCTMARDDFMHNYAITLMANFLGVHIGN